MTTVDEELPNEAERLDMAISAAADALLSVCAIQTGTEPSRAVDRAIEALASVMTRAQIEARLRS